MTDQRITYNDAWHRAMSDFQIRETEQSRRVAMLGIHSENRRAKRKARIEGLIIAALILFAGFAWWGNRPAQSSLAPGAVHGTIAAPGTPLTAENAPIVLKPLVKHKAKKK